MVSERQRRTAGFKRAIVDAWKIAPVTLLIGVAITALYLAETVTGWFWNGGPRGLDDAFGGVAPLSIPAIKDLTGPLALWNGQWWRIPVSGLHHAGLLHLACNLSGLWFVGTLLESRMRWFSYLLFFLTSLTISLLPEFLMEHYVVGISGALCAMFGMLLALRRRDWRLREVITENFIRVTMLLLIAFIPLTVFGWLPVANVAHFTGLVYGWIAGEVFFGTLCEWRIGQILFVTCHLSLLPLFFAVTHPVWIGRYHLYLASRAAAAEHWNEFDNELKQAVAISPDLSEAWDLLAADQDVRQHDLLEAWRTVITGMKFNPSNDQGLKIAREVFAKLHAKQADTKALQILDEVFGSEAPQWKERLTSSTLAPGKGFLPDAGDNALEGQPT